MEGDVDSRRLWGPSGRRQRSLGWISLLPVLVALFFLLPSEGSSIASPASTQGFATNPSTGSPVQVVVNGVANQAILSSCSFGWYAISDALDLANGYLYVSAFNQSLGSFVSIVRLPCQVVATVSLEWGASKLAYDPSTREIVATPGLESERNLVYVLHGTSLAATVHLGDFLACPYSVEWDPAIGGLLIGNSGFCGGGGISILHLVLVNGVTKSSVISDVFDSASATTDMLVADGYVFTVGNTLGVFNDRTFTYLGSFVVFGCFFSPIAWDPVKNAAVHQMCGPDSEGQPVEQVVFLSANSIPTRQFSFTELRAPGILEGGAGGLAYSPETRELYLSASGGNDVWELSESAKLTHVYLGQNANLGQLTYDPRNQDVYVLGDRYNSELGTFTGMLYAIQ
jgi:DNA-binding beta-propeller fold protein YncE